jgi:hypothetical protein
MALEHHFVTFCLSISLTVQSGFTPGVKRLRIFWNTLTLVDLDLASWHWSPQSSRCIFKLLFHSAKQYDSTIVPIVMSTHPPEPAHLHRRCSHCGVCSTQKALLLPLQFILNSRPEVGHNPQARPPPAGSSASSPAVGAKDDDILPPSLVYLDCWLPETAASYSQNASRGDSEPRLREAVDQHSLNQNQASGAQHLNPARGTDIKAIGHHGGKGTCGGVRNRQEGLGAGSGSAARSALANLGERHAQSAPTLPTCCRHCI